MAQRSEEKKNISQQNCPEIKPGDTLIVKLHTPPDSDIKPDQVVTVEKINKEHYFFTNKAGVFFAWIPQFHTPPRMIFFIDGDDYDVETIQVC